MSLVTRCPACSTAFKVVRDQLRISEGWVRCGRCSQVFDATLDLMESDDGVPHAPATPSTAPSSEARSTAFDSTPSDLAEAVESPRRLSADPGPARRVLDLVPGVPTPVWGRDELGAGEMWNSNSLISWLIVRAGLPLEAARLPAGGRAPGWDAGIVVARRGR